jgi:hypothetical protein
MSEITPQHDDQLVLFSTPKPIVDNAPISNFIASKKGGFPTMAEMALLLNEDDDGHVVYVLRCLLGMYMKRIPNDLKNRSLFYHLIQSELAFKQTNDKNKARQSLIQIIQKM